MGPRPIPPIDRRFPKSEVGKADAETEKARQEAIGGQCVLTEEGNEWRLVCKFLGAAGESGGQ